MVLVRGRPILAHLEERLRAAGYTRILLVTGYRGEIIEEYFRGSRDISFVRQAEISGTGSAALLAREFVGGDPFLLTYGDILADAGCYRRILAILEQDPACDAVFAVKDVDDPYQGAAVYANEGGRITRIVEKPPKGESTTRWNSAGIYAFRPSIFDELQQVPLSPRGEYELTSAVCQLLEKGRNVRLFPIEGAWRDIGRPEDVAALEVV